MKPAVLNRELETDDGNFNIEWWIDHPKIGHRPCEWKVFGANAVPCGKDGKYWCQECGLITCKGHRKNHSESPIHKMRMEKWESTSQ